MKHLICALPAAVFLLVLSFLALQREIVRIARRVYIRVWLSWNSFCKHGNSNRRLYDECGECDRDKRRKRAERSNRELVARNAEMDKAERLAKEL